MTQTRMQQLRQVAQMLRARDLARLGKLERQRQELATRLGLLSTRMDMTEDPALNAARLAHASWAQAQRIGLNQALARQTVLTLDQKARTARSVGRAEALDKLAQDARRKR
ncbi:MAG: hypothetical protein GVY34_04870 [Alphaproteobacteria bacterium]|jgi:hypothetical protein|nr:hypothetical protein [Alphaproteobacteria bacterium]